MSLQPLVQYILAPIFVGVVVGVIVAVVNHWLDDHDP